MRVLGYSVRGGIVMSALFEYRSDQIYCHHSLDERPEAERFQIHVHETPEVYCFLSGSGKNLTESAFSYRGSSFFSIGAGKKGKS